MYKNLSVPARRRVSTICIFSYFGGQDYPCYRMKRNWFLIITPCRIAIVLAILGIIDGYADMRHSGGWSYLAVIICSIFLAVVAAIDFAIALIVRKKAGLLWLIELILIGITILILKKQFGLWDYR